MEVIGFFIFIFPFFFVGCAAYEIVRFFVVGERGGGVRAIRPLTHARAALSDVMAGRTPLSADTAAVRSEGPGAAASETAAGPGAREGDVAASAAVRGMIARKDGLSRRISSRGMSPEI